MTMTEGVTTRLQKEVSQLQKDMEKMSLKMDSMADQLRGEFQVKILKGFKVLKLEMVRMNQKQTDHMVATEVTKNSPGVTELTSAGFHANSGVRFAGGNSGILVDKKSSGHVYGDFITLLDSRSIRCAAAFASPNGRSRCGRRALSYCVISSKILAA